ncbi:MAG: hypothetical protein WBC18_14635 [Ottowia sp.]|uniref:hypothetical protein n=1 Tax=Ottowia sp. TaxID=1898956 RepID=UPI003C72F9B5
MSNIVPIRPTRRVTITAHRVMYELVPPAILEQLFHAAIAVGWAAGDGAYSADNPDAQERLEDLERAVSAASQYTVPVEHEVDEPIFPPGSRGKPS